MSEKKLILQGEEEKKKGIHYEVDLEKKLGEGGMGRVYFGYRVDEKRGIRNEVAVKFLYGNLMEEEIRRARREASIQLRNDNLVEMYGLVEIQSTDQTGTPIRRLHVVSEYLNGVTLLDLMNGKVTDKFGNPIAKAQEFLEQYKEKRERFAVNVLKNVLSGIMALHDAGYIHRDIDPSNIMLTDDGHIKLIDFGVAHKMVDLKGDDHMRTTGGTIIGKFAYAAPELVLGDIDNHNETTDIYALGILFFQLLTGHLPFSGSYSEIVQAQIHQTLPLDEIKDDRLREIIKKATEKKQADRYGSAAEFRVALDKFRSLRPTPGHKSKQEQKSVSETIPMSEVDLYSRVEISSEPNQNATVVGGQVPPPVVVQTGRSNGSGNQTIINAGGESSTTPDKNGISWWYILSIILVILAAIALVFGLEII